MSVFLNHSQILNSVIASQKRIENQYMPMIKTLKTSALLDMSRFDAVIGAATTNMLRDMAKVTPMIEAVRNAALRDAGKVAPIIEVARSTAAFRDIARMTPIIDMAKKSFDISRVFSNLGQSGILLGDIGKIFRFPTPMTQAFMGAFIKSLESWKNFELYPDRVDDWARLFDCLEDIKSSKDNDLIKEKIIKYFCINKSFYRKKAQRLLLPGSVLLKPEDIDQDFLEAFSVAYNKACNMSYRAMKSVETDVFKWFRSEIEKAFYQQLKAKGDFTGKSEDPSKRVVLVPLDSNSPGFYDVFEQLPEPIFDKDKARQVFNEVAAEADNRLLRLRSDSSHEQREMIQRILSGEITDIRDLNKEYHPNRIYAMKKQLKQADDFLGKPMLSFLRDGNEGFCF
jgi:hypothetical protein